LQICFCFARSRRLRPATRDAFIYPVAELPPFYFRRGGN
jgi:hypothetical protein